MPSYKVSGGVEGAATTLLEHVQRQTKRREDEEDAQREWHRKVQSIILSSPKDYSDEAINAALLGKSLAGLPIRRPFTPPAIPPELEASGLSYQDPVTGVTRSYGRPYRKADSLSAFFGGGDLGGTGGGEDELRQRAIEELRLLGEPIDEENIQEAMRQLSGQ